jgi:hypothetical protein
MAILKRPWFDENGTIIRDGVDKTLVHGDLPDFVSPIDGTVVRGRAGLRDHCARHNVVPTEDLKGLPFVPPEHKPDNKEIRETIERIIHQKGYDHG